MMLRNIFIYKYSLLSLHLYWRRHEIDLSEINLNGEVEGYIMLIIDTDIMVFNIM